ncbi:MAG: ribonuclease HI [Treponema sp.]|jgi:ribonuclease HI|nr:ribonuclease HI [Treponema sp.]
MDENSNSEIIIFTDGGCSGNPGPGGWAAVILADGKEIQLSGGAAQTTNNRMELSAAISALENVAGNPCMKNRGISIYSDSQYVKNGITVWIKGWKARGWKTADKKPVKNQDLWQKLDLLANSTGKTVSWKWVKGHAGIKYNELCDTLCGKEIAKFS